MNTTKPFAELEVSSAAPLPREGAFVVQLAPSSCLASGELRGRVEHVVSGAADTFQSIDQLRTFLIRVLGQIPELESTSGGAPSNENQGRARCDTTR